jgi:hypothetical protein
MYLVRKLTYESHMEFLGHCDPFTINKTPSEGFHVVKSIVAVNAGPTGFYKTTG